MYPFKKLSDIAWIEKSQGNFEFNNKDHMGIHYSYRDLHSKKRTSGITYFSIDCPIYHYISAFDQTNCSPAEEAAFLEALNQVCYLQENGLADALTKLPSIDNLLPKQQQKAQKEINTQSAKQAEIKTNAAFYAQSARLALIAAGLWNDYWKDFDFENQQHAEFCHFIISLNIEELKYFQQDLTKPQLQQNQYQIINSIRIFFNTQQKKDKALRQINKELEQDDQSLGDNLLSTFTDLVPLLNQTVAKEPSAIPPTNTFGIDGIEDQNKNEAKDYENTNINNPKNQTKNNILTIQTVDFVEGKNNPTVKLIDVKGKSITTAEIDLMVKAAKLRLMAAGFWDKTIKKEFEKKYTNKDYHFFSFITQLSETQLKQPWLKEFLPVILDFPAIAINTLKNGDLINNRYSIVQYGNDFFAVDILSPLGKGGQGQVIKGYRLNPEGRLYFESVWALKFLTQDDKKTYNQEKAQSFLERDSFSFIDDKKKELSKEATYTRRKGQIALSPKECTTKFKYISPENNPPNLNNKDQIQIEDTFTENLILPMQFIPGQNVSDENKFEKLHSLLKDCTFSQRAQLAQQLTLAISHLHKKKMRHGDIKGSNLQILKHQNSCGQTIFDLELLDHGNSGDIDEFDHLKFMGNLDGNDTLFEVHDHSIGGSLHTAAPEMVFKRVAFDATDTYACAALYAAIFNADDPFREREKVEKKLINYKEQNKDPDPIKVRNFLKGLVKTKFNLTGLGKGIKLNENYAFVINCIENFINHCQHDGYRTRPLDERQLQFFSTLTIFAALTENGIKKTDEDSVNLLAVKLILFSEKMWNTTISKDSILKYSELDFEKNTEVCEKIIDAYKEQIKPTNTAINNIDGDNTKPHITEEDDGFNNTENKIDKHCDSEKKFKSIKQEVIIKENYPATLANLFKSDKKLTQTITNTIKIQSIEQKIKQQFDSYVNPTGIVGFFKREHKICGFFKPAFRTFKEEDVRQMEGKLLQLLHNNDIKTAFATLDYYLEFVKEIKKEMDASEDPSSLAKRLISIRETLKAEYPAEHKLFTASKSNAQLPNVANDIDTPEGTIHSEENSITPQ